ncbi:MAG: acyltransferase [Pseudomonadota bacterium]
MNPTAPGLPAAAGRENNLTFVRLFLACLVLVSHAPEIVDGNRRRELLFRLFHDWSLGQVAVAGFFLLSGYLILQSWERAPRLAPYLAKRWRRILPGFAFASLVSALVVGPLASDARQYFSQFQPLEFLTGVALLKPPVVPPVFAGSFYPLVNGSMWTIEYEARCYLVVAALGLAGITRRRWCWAVVTAAVFLLWRNETLARVLAFPGARHVILDRTQFLCFLSFFCTGGCFYLFRDRIPYSRPGILLAALAVNLGLLIPALAQPTLALAGAYLLFAFSFARLPGLAWFGGSTDLSYGVYLYGWPTQKLIHWYAPALSPWWLLLLTVPVCLTCGLLSWRFIEKPLLRPAARASTLAAQPAGFGGTGLRPHQ